MVTIEKKKNYLVITGEDGAVSAINREQVSDYNLFSTGEGWNAESNRDDWFVKVDDGCESVIFEGSCEDCGAVLMALVEWAAE